MLRGPSVGVAALGGKLYVVGGGNGYCYLIFDPLTRYMDRRAVGWIHPTASARLFGGATLVLQH